MVSVDLEWDLECLSISDCHSSENNSLLLVADDYVLKKEIWNVVKYGRSSSCC